MGEAAPGRGDGSPCPFCPDPGGKIPGVVVWEEELLRVIMDRYPVAPGHLLILPRRHHDSIDAIPVPVLARIAIVSRAAVAALRRVMRSDGASIVVQLGQAASQSVAHVHWHVVPRWTGDGLHHDDGDRTVFTYRHAEVAGWVLEEQARGLRAALGRALEDGAR